MKGDSKSSETSQFRSIKVLQLEISNIEGQHWD